MNLEDQDKLRMSQREHARAIAESARWSLSDSESTVGDPLSCAVTKLVGNQPTSATRDCSGVTTLKYDTLGGPLSVRIFGPEGGVTEVSLQAPMRPAEVIYHPDALKVADYWGWNWVRQSERLNRESYLEMVRDALKKAAQPPALTPQQP